VSAVQKSPLILGSGFWHTDILSFTELEVIGTGNKGHGGFCLGRLARSSSRAVCLPDPVGVNEDELDPGG
jgi:hypothetical protein